MWVFLIHLMCKSHSKSFHISWFWELLCSNSHWKQKKIKRKIQWVGEWRKNLQPSSHSSSFLQATLDLLLCQSRISCHFSPKSRQRFLWGYLLEVVVSSSTCKPKKIKKIFCLFMLSTALSVEDIIVDPSSELEAWVISILFLTHICSCASPFPNKN